MSSHLCSDGSAYHLFAAMQLRASPLLHLGPAHPRNTAELLDNQHCLVRVEHELSRRQSAPSAEAEAAAAGAVWGRDSSPVLGSSPPNSFGYEFVRFMHNSVQARSSGKKSRCACAVQRVQCHVLCSWRGASAAWCT